MPAAPKPYDNVWQYLRDVALAFGFIIGGFVVSGAISQPFRNVTELAYPAALCIGLIPFWWFLRRCQIHDFDWYDSAALAACFLVASAVRSILAGSIHPWIERAVVCVVFGVCLAGWGKIRRKSRRSDGLDDARRDAV